MVHVVDDIGTIFAQSKRSQAEFPDYAQALRKAISLARYVQEPLAELTYMWAQGVGDTGLRGEEMLYLNLVRELGWMGGFFFGRGVERRGGWVGRGHTVVAVEAERGGRKRPLKPRTPLTPPRALTHPSTPCGGK